MKICPVCGAGAFDDAEVCFGCLHRYESPVPGNKARPTAPAMSIPSMRSEGADFWPESGLSPTKPGITEKVQSSSGSGCSQVPGMREIPLEATAVIEPPQRASFQENSGWIVRFEFPGFMPMNEGCGLLRGGTTKDDSSCDMVVRLQPIPPVGAVDRRRGRPTRGSHVRTPDRDDIAAVAVPGRL